MQEHTWIGSDHIALLLLSKVRPVVRQIAEGQGSISVKLRVGVKCGTWAKATQYDRFDQGEDVSDVSR